LQEKLAILWVNVCEPTNSSSAVTFFDDSNCSQLVAYSERDYMIDDLGVLVRIEKLEFNESIKALAYCVMAGPFDG
jgi:hypothetical protein